MAATRNGSSLESFPCTLSSRTRYLARKQAEYSRSPRFLLHRANPLYIRCMHEESTNAAEDSTEHRSEGGFKAALDAYFDKLESKSKVYPSNASEAEQEVKRSLLETIKAEQEKQQHMQRFEGVKVEDGKDQQQQWKSIDDGYGSTQPQHKQEVKGEEEKHQHQHASDAIEVEHNKEMVNQWKTNEGSKDEQGKWEAKDEYALKEKLLFSVLREFEEAEAKQRDASKKTSPANTEQIQDTEPTPLLVLNPDLLKDSTGNKKDMPILFLQPGSLLVSTIVGINIGVYIFGCASSLQTENGVDVAFLSGAKINDLILAGEWWRLFTPAFLHSGPLHLFLSCWAMISFGPQVESLYGSFGLFLIYLLGAAIGNLTSLFQTSQATVGGTAPVFAVICSWIVFLVKNRHVIRTFRTSELLQKVLVFSALSVLLGNELPIDAWTHVGGALVGILFGVVASPWYRQFEDSQFNTDKSDLTLERLALAFVLFSGVLLCLYYLGLDENSIDDITNYLN